MSAAALWYEAFAFHTNSEEDEWEKATSAPNGEKSTTAPMEKTVRKRKKKQQNQSNYSNPQVDALLEQAGVAGLSGTAFGAFGEGAQVVGWDCITGTYVGGNIYPKGKNEVFLYKGGTWIGGIVGGLQRIQSVANRDTKIVRANPNFLRLWG